MPKQNHRAKLSSRAPSHLQTSIHAPSSADKPLEVDSCQLFTSLMQTNTSTACSKKQLPALCDISLLISSHASKTSDTDAKIPPPAQNLNNDRRFSFFSANPTEKRVFYNNHEIAQWQASIQQGTCSSAKKKAIPFQSGWIGYLAYPTTSNANNVNSTNNKRTKPAALTKTPDRAIAEFNYYPWTICFDHNENRFHLLGQPDQAAQDAYAWLLRQHDASPAPANKPFSAHPFVAVWSKSDYQQAFDQVQAYLLAGDCYQVNLTQPFVSQAYQGSACATIQPLLQALKPSFGCYFQGQACELVSMSPERFISISDQGKLEAKPIKGTIKRSNDLTRDNALISELRGSEKNKAENLMIVDLLRNDLSISATPGSVTVDKLFELESHPNVHHLVSTISAQLQPDTHPAEAISRAFPGGSITGAPKKRAMEIIEELEAQPRSLYCGSFGYFSDSGHVDFNILIRSLEFRDNTITCWGGGGITVDSDCDEEYEESLTKIRRIMDTIEKI